MNNYLNQIKNKPFFLWGSCFILFLMILDLFFFKEPSEVLFFILIISWFGLNKKNKIDGGLSIAAGLSFLMLCPFFMFFNEKLAERAGIWSFLLLLSGTISIFLDERAKRESSSRLSTHV